MIAYTNKVYISCVKLESAFKCAQKGQIQNILHTQKVSSRPLLSILTDNPLYTDTQYNDKIRYNDNLTVTKPLLKK